MRLIQWQTSPKWCLWYYYKYENSYAKYAWWEYIICTGPFQFRFGGKPWKTHLERSPEYTSAIKAILKDDLKVQKFD